VQYFSRCRGRMLCLAAVLVLFVGTLAGGGWLRERDRVEHARALASGTTLQFPHRLYLVISRENMARVRAVAPGLAAKVLASPTTFVTTPVGLVPDPGASVTTRLYFSYAKFISDLRRSAIPAGVRAVAYDPELWHLTPWNEQVDPTRYMELFAQAARRSGYAPILMPGRDILLSAAGHCRKLIGERLDEAFLRCGLVRGGARLARMFEIQTQPDELNTQALRRFAAQSAAQARSVNRSVVLLADFSTVLRRRTVVSPWQLVRDVEAIRPYVSGFQLNATRQSTGILVSFLRAVSAAGG
jgi:hypothetical protein